MMVMMMMILVMLMDVDDDATVVCLLRDAPPCHASGSAGLIFAPLLFGTAGGGSLRRDWRPTLGSGKGNVHMF